MSIPAGMLVYLNGVRIEAALDADQEAGWVDMNCKSDAPEAGGDVVQRVEGAIEFYDRVNGRNV